MLECSIPYARQYQIPLTLPVGGDHPLASTQESTLGAQITSAHSFLSCQADTVVDVTIAKQWTSTGAKQQCIISTSPSSAQAQTLLQW